MILVVRVLPWDWVWFYEIDGGLPEPNDAERYTSADAAIQGGNVASMGALQALECMARRIDVVPTALFKSLFGLSSCPVVGREVEIVLHR